MKKRVKRLIHVACTSAVKYPERPIYLLVRGRRFPVASVVQMKKIQSSTPPFRTVHFYRVELEDGRVVDLEYHEKKMEWYLIEEEGEDRSSGVE